MGKPGIQFQEEKIVSGSGKPGNAGSSALTGGDSSQMMFNKLEDSQEQIALLPESAFTNNMQNLNIKSHERGKAQRDIIGPNDEKIDFYQDPRVDTEISNHTNNMAIPYDLREHAQ